MSRKIRVGITGQSGFIGTHLFNVLGLYPERFERVPFEDNFFENPPLLAAFASKCDTIVHLAAVNRHADSKILYDTNISLVNKLVLACDSSAVKPNIIYSSSIQEEYGTLYGESKKEGRAILEDWTKNNGSSLTSFLLPNVFGPFGKPFHNSVVSTFCYLLSHDGEPRIDVDNNIGFVYVGDVVKAFINEIENIPSSTMDRYTKTIEIPPYKNIKVSRLLELLAGFKECYLNQGMVPALDSPFERDLFNTFICYIDHQTFYPFKLKHGTDNRGSFVEVVRSFGGGQVSYSTTKPGITRGNHFHTRKAERFAVVKGKARIDLRKIGDSNVLSFELDGSDPSFVDMPVWYTHNITNIGSDDLYTIFWISEHYDPNDPDTFTETV